MDEMTLFARLRPVDTLGEADLEELRAELFPDLAAAVPEDEHPAHAQAGHRVARFALAAAAVVAVLGSGGLWLALDRLPGSRPTAPATQPDASPTTAAAPGPVASSLFGAPAVDIDWTAVEPDPSIAGAIIESMTAGPGGFVAVGSRPFDGGASADGHVWFSPDGEHWTSVADDTFRDRIPAIVVATSTAYFVLAPPPSPDDQQPDLFRSTDAQTWEPTGPPDAMFGGLVAIDETLIVVEQTMQANGDITLTERSSADDGDTWTPPTSDDPPMDFSFDPQVISTASRWFVASREPRGEGVARYLGTTVRQWKDGHLESTVPSPTIYGSMAPTASGLVVLGATNAADGCPPGDAEPDPAGPLIDWEACRYDLVLEGWDPGETAWQPIGALDAPTPSPDAGMWTFGNQLVATTQRPDAGLAVWTSADGTTWSNPVNTDATDPASWSEFGPTGHTLGASNDTTIVIPVVGPGLAGLQQFVVGHIAP